QTEKMSSLGQLVAGLAHEINNPLTFIDGNITHAHRYAHELMELIQLYNQHYPQPAPEITDLIESIDLDFVRADFPKLLNSMNSGVQRILQIILSLRNFSRLDEAELKQVDIHQGIENTLLILQHRLNSPNSTIQLVRNYGNIPLVECYPGQLNQVFMNLLNNAIDALEKSADERLFNDSRILPSKDSRNRSGVIKISTDVITRRATEPHHLGNAHGYQSIVIRIADNGPGIPPQVQEHIFDPFFTTKPVGQGTGLGLSISYQIIVEQHGGQILCCSEPARGTEFIIEIPVTPVKAKSINTLVPFL
ncbi:MAG TPA: ATP-binding protein, partial [Coleofasciculaceae cyanobacterium]